MIFLIENDVFVVSAINLSQAAPLTKLYKSQKQVIMLLTQV